MSPFLLPVAFVAALLAADVDVIPAYEEGSVQRLDGAGSVRYLSGGVGSEAREGLARAGKAFPLKVVLATSPGGRYLALAGLTVLDEQGKAVVKLEGLGPWIYLDLPAGSYRLEGLRKEGGAATAGPVTIVPGRQLVVPLFFPEGPRDRNPAGS